MPSNRELQRELIKANNQILQLQKENKELAAASDSSNNLCNKFLAQKNDLAERNKNLHHRLKEAGHLLLKQDEEIEKLQVANIELRNTPSASDIMNQRIAYTLPGGRNRIEMISEILKGYNEIHIRCEKMEANWQSSTRKNNKLRQEYNELRDRKKIEIKVINAPLGMTIKFRYNGQELVKTIDELVHSFICLSDNMKNLEKEITNDKLPLSKRTVSYIYESKIVKKTVSDLLDDYIQLLKDRKWVSIYDQKVIINLDGNVWEPAVSTLVEEFLEIRKRYANFERNNSLLLDEKHKLQDRVNELVLENDTQERTFLANKKVSISIDRDKKVFTISELMRDYIRIYRQLAGIRKECRPYGLDDKIDVSSDGIYRLISIRTLIDTYFASFKLNEEMDVYKSAINDLYNLASGEKGYL